MSTLLERQWFGGAGPRDGQAIVMLHHGLGSVSTWRTFPAAVHTATGLPVLVYSRTGHGASPGATIFGDIRFMHQSADEELPALLKEERITKPILVGHSDGASIAALYAGTIGQDRVAGCVLLAPHVFVESCTVESAAAARTEFESGSLREKLASHHRDVDGVFALWSGAWLHPDFLTWNIEREVSGIQCPVAVVQGLDDPYGTTAQADRIVAALTRSPRTVVLAECGHEPHRDHPDVVLDTIVALGREAGL